MVKTVLPLQGAQVQFLLRELRSCMPCQVVQPKKKRVAETVEEVCEP